ncbi:MAG TPA: SRPBCC family protein [Streptosporangiaceae bacterium]|jgi:carbon monoxide dehydrogenase subunit G|nr:SRPBCC family protein [Streptosporangiaceae bacterium]
MADRTSSGITVAAPRATIMSVIADFAAYPQWAGGVRSAEVIDPGADDRARSVRFVIDAGLIKDSYMLAYEWDADSAVSWQLAQGGSMISELTGAYQLADDGPGTKVTYELTVGLKVPMLGVMRRRAEKTIIDTALRGLRTRAQELAGGAA